MDILAELNSCHVIRKIPSSLLRLEEPGGLKWGFSVFFVFLDVTNVTFDEGIAGSGCNDLSKI
jgi:hypothetical protein